MASPARVAEAERLLAAVESHVTDRLALGRLAEEVRGADLDPADRDELLGRIGQYLLDCERWEQEGLPEGEQNPDAGVGFAGDPVPVDPDDDA